MPGPHQYLVVDYPDPRTEKPLLAIVFHTTHGSILVSRSANARGDLPAELLHEPSQSVFIDRTTNPGGDIYFPPGATGQIVIGPSDFNNLKADGSGFEVLTRLVISITFHNNTPEMGGIDLSILPAYLRTGPEPTAAAELAKQMQENAEFLNQPAAPRELSPGERFTYCVVLRLRS